MAQSGYTPILIYGSGTATNVPLAANLTSSASGTELALNYADGKLFYKDSGGVVQVLATKGAAQNSISFGTTGLTPNTATQGAVTVAGTLITSNGGTGLSSYTAGDLPYYASGTALSKLAIGTNGKILSSSGSAPQWVDLSTLGVNTFSAGTTGLTPSSATSGAITLAGTLNVSSGGTGLTSLTAGYIPYGNGTSAFSSSANLTFDGTNLTVNGLIQATGTPSNPTGTTSSFYNGSGIGPVISGYQFAIRTGGTPAESLRVDNNGNVGIGTSSPNGKLSVAGIVKSTALSTIGNDGVWMDFSAPNGRIAAINSSGSPASNLLLASTTTGGTTQTVLQCSYDGTAKVLSTLGVGNTAGSTSGAGISFPATQSASSDANTLDDYEEGTWTPTIGGTATYSRQEASYTKIGRVVTVRFDMTITLLLTGSTTTISGLPFSVGNQATSEGYGATGYFSNLAINVTSLTCYAAANTSSIYFNSLGAAGATANQNPAIFGNSTRVQGMVTYFTT